MEILIMFIAVGVLLAAFELAAVRFGTDSRDGFSDSRGMRSGGGSF